MQLDCNEKYPTLSILAIFLSSSYYSYTILTHLNQELRFEVATYNQEKIFTEDAEILFLSLSLTEYRIAWFESLIRFE